jgi:hypothetical protein
VIGVLSKSGQRQAVEEFFELFKTPWEFYRPEQTYDVVIATVNDIPHISAPLLIVCGSEENNVDRRVNAFPRLRHAGKLGRGARAIVRSAGVHVPIYGELLTFAVPDSVAVLATTGTDCAGFQCEGSGGRVVRIGYDLFDEARFLLTAGQPVEHAHVPTLDVHIQMLRDWMANAGVSFVEIPPTPAGYACTVCLTHDIDFVGIRRHVLDHTMWGFVYRATVGAVRNCLRRRLGLRRLLKSWRAAASLPFVYLGWARDFWDPFRWYLDVEQQLPATYFLIPFKKRRGERVPGRHARRRATAYDVTDVSDWATALIEHGCEVGVHGIDAWNDAEKGAVERNRIAGITREQHVGIRMHWLLGESASASKLEEAGYSYDASSGYNETLGYRNGTTQAFRPFTTSNLLELPLHIQDGALFYPHNLDLSEDEAAKRCRPLIDHVRSSGGVLTLLWHDRSHAPERFWGDTYVGLVQTLRSSNAWFATASQAVDWFRARRRVSFQRVEGGRGDDVRLCYEGRPIEPPLILRRHRRTGAGDVVWNGVSAADVASPLRIAS